MELSNFQRARLEESLLILENDGYSVTCERTSDDVVYAPNITTKLGASFPAGAWCQSLSTGEYVHMDWQASVIAEQYLSPKDSEIRRLESRIKETYEQMLAPLQIKPVHKRPWGSVLATLGICAIYPLAVAGTMA